MLEKKVILLADVKWIKITTDIFDDEKILLIESMPDAYAIITVWFKLLCLAGKMNNSGVFMMSNQIAYTDKMLATIFRMNESTVTLALNAFEMYGMIEIVDGVITIPNWEKHQNLDQLEKIKEQTRIRVAKHREKQKLLSCNVTDNVTDDITVTQRNATDKIREDIEEDKNKNRIDYQLIADMYNSTCTSYPYIKSLSDARKKAIKARLNTYSINDFQTLFEKAEASTFLKGGNSNNWSATFDWLIKDANMAKVLDGNYDNRSASKNNFSGNKVADQLDDFYSMAADWSGENG